MAKPDISTLVSDIRALLDNGHETNQEVPDIGGVISNRLKEHLEPRSEKTLRASNLGYPLRKLWYAFNYKGTVEQPSADAKLKWLSGDIWEAVLLWLAAEAGHAVRDQQKEVRIDGIVGHIDAMIDGVVVDVKTASSPSYKRFNKDEMWQDPFLSIYLSQLAFYSEALECDGAFLVVDKTLCHLKLVPFSREELKQIRIKDVIKEKKGVITSSKTPERCYQPIVEDNQNERLPIACGYCPYLSECWKDYSEEGIRTFKYSTGWRHYVKVEKTPRVEEIFIKDIK